MRKDSHIILWHQTHPCTPKFYKLVANYCKSLLLTVSGLLSDSISFLGNTFDVMQLVLLHIALKVIKNNSLILVSQKRALRNIQVYKIIIFIIIRFQIKYDQCVCVCFFFRVNGCSMKTHEWRLLINPNPLHPNISVHILHTVLYTFPKVLTWRICLTIKSFSSWWSIL